MVRSRSSNLNFILNPAERKKTFGRCYNGSNGYRIANSPGYSNDLPPHHNIKGSGDGGCPLKSYLMCSTAPYDNIQV